MQDSCAGTLTRVTEGTVSVRDKVKKRTIVLARPGKRYLARPAAVSGRTFVCPRHADPLVSLWAGGGTVKGRYGMRWTRMILTAAVTLAVTAAPASAATFRVVTHDRQHRACSGTECPSIRSAIAAAALTEGADTIVVPAGDYQLNIGQLLVNTPVTIVGDGARRTHDPRQPERVPRARGAGRRDGDGVRR